MTNAQVTEPHIARISPDAASRPKAVGFVRGDASGRDAPRHADAVQRYARSLGYRYVHTIRPPRDHADPVAYALDLAAGLDADVIVVYDLSHVDNQPGRVCECFDLETVCPATTWARAAGAEPAGTEPAA